MPISASGALPPVARPRRGPVATLALLSPLIGEVLFGAVPLSFLPFGLLGLVGLYGGGALLVRELVRRRGLPSYWLVLLGLAYGVLEEGTVVQSLFDQHFRGLDFLGFYGHWVGVNWVWALFIVPYHAVFSIAIPILLVELMYPARRQEAWLGSWELVVTAAIFIGNAGWLAVFHTGLFTAKAPLVSAPANVMAAVLVLAIVIAAFRATPHETEARDADPRSASPRRARLLGLASGLAWFVGFRVLIIGTGTLVTAPAALASGALIALVIAWRVGHWSSGGRAWTPESTCGVIAGALPTCWLMGFVIAVVSGGNPVVNLVGHVIFGVLMFEGLRRLRRHVKASCASSLRT
jgi:hypothetical protein